MITQRAPRGRRHLRLLAQASWQLLFSPRSCALLLLLILLCAALLCPLPRPPRTLNPGPAPGSQLAAAPISPRFCCSPPHPSTSFTFQPMPPAQQPPAAAHVRTRQLSRAAAATAAAAAAAAAATEGAAAASTGAAAGAGTAAGGGGPPDSSIIPAEMRAKYAGMRPEEFIHEVLPHLISPMGAAAGACRQRSWPHLSRADGSLRMCSCRPRLSVWPRALSCWLLMWAPYVCASC